jgi:hypothetical protein
VPPASSVQLTCPSCSSREFEIRALKDEGLASLRCVECHRDYLLLDSGDYWFDVIQGGYPRTKRCRCKSTSFRTRCDYEYWDDGGVRFIEVFATCVACRKVTKVLDTEIDCGDTNSLVTEPLKYCKNPKILYALHLLNLCVSGQDIASVVDFLYEHHHCTFYARLRQNSRWVTFKIDQEEVKQAIFQSAKRSTPAFYLWIYAAKHDLEIPDAEVESMKSEDVFWKRHELIRISSPTHISLGQGEESLDYYINFSNEYVENEEIIPKSGGFSELTISFMGWLATRFVTWRGPLCFDNPEEHVRQFGERFTNGRSTDV